MKATDQLREEHQAVETLILILGGVSQRLQKGQDVNPEHLKQLAEFISVFMEKCHHKKEEGYLFPAMLGSDIPDKQIVKKLIEDHLGFYKLIAEITAVFNNYNPANPKTSMAVTDIIQRYIPLLKAHAEEEGRVAFVLADEYLSPEIQEKMYHDFEGFETRQIGQGTHEKFHRMLDELEKIYLT